MPTYLERRDPAEILSRLSHLDVTGKISKQHMVLRSGGGSSDVYQSRLSDGTVVAIRQLRSHLFTMDSQADLQKSIALELRIWSDLHHPNILPLLGYTNDFGDTPACVTEWMFNGTVTQYLRDKPNSDRLALVKGIAAGLEYLHSKHVVHSDIKAANVVVSPNGTPLLLDFGLSHLLVISRTIMTPRRGTGTCRWMAYELLVDSSDDEGDLPSQIATKMSDVWSFGMTMLEIMTGMLPYAEYTNNERVHTAITSRRLPSKPSMLRSTDEVLWSLCQKCWKHVPASRPSMAEILEEINRVTFTGCLHIGMIPRAKLHTLLSGESPDLELVFDLSAPDMRLFMRDPYSPQSSPHVADPNRLLETATYPPTTSMRITCMELAPFDTTPAWTVAITQRHPISVGYVFSAIYALLRTQITHTEWYQLAKTDADEVEHAYTCRSLLNSYERKQGVRRVDFLRKKVMFAGLVRKTDDDSESFELLVKASQSSPDQPPHEGTGLPSLLHQLWKRRNNLQWYGATSLKAQESLLTLRGMEAQRRRGLPYSKIVRKPTVGIATYLENNMGISALPESSTVPQAGIEEANDLPDGVGPSTMAVESKNLNSSP